MDKFRTHITQLRAFPNHLHESVSSLLPDVLQYRPQPTGWSILEHIGHVIDIDRIYAQRIDSILTQEYQPFVLFSIDDVHRQGAYHTKSVAELITQLAETRHVLGQTLENLTETDIRRIGLDDYFGPITLARLIEILVDHEDEHYQQICAITASVSPQLLHPTAVRSYTINE